MYTDLLATKMHMPAPGGAAVPRPHLVQRLSEGLALQRRLTLVSAPAGYGKTTLVASWLRALPVNRPHDAPTIAWLTLDAEDSDPVRFWSHVIAALHTAQPGLGAAALSLLQTPELASLTPVVTLMVNACAAHHGPLLLVLDDYHTIVSQPVHESLSFFLAHQPATLHLVLIGRADPPLPLARWRARGQVTEVRTHDLRFAPQEALALLSQQVDRPLSPETAQAWIRRTEGWAAGLQLAALSLRAQPGAVEMPDDVTGQDRYILDYLLEEVLAHQPQEVRAFLLQTAVLDRLCGPLCDAVVGSHTAEAADGSQAILEDLERANLFVIPLDNRRTWYRYHHLFADLLRHQLHRNALPGLPAPDVLHRRAADWYAGQGLAEAAIQHRLASGDFAVAAGEIARQAETLWTRGEVVTLNAWFDALPEPVREAQPLFTILRAWALVLSGQAGQLEVADRQLAHLLAGPCTPETTALCGRAAAVRSVIASMRGDVVQAHELAESALRALPEEDRTWRGAAAFALGHAYYVRGEPARALAAYRESAHLNRAAGNAHLA